LEIAAALHEEIFDIRPQRIARAGIDGIGALARVLDDLIETVVDDVGVVAGPAVHVVGTGPAVDVVVAAVAHDGVDEAVADSLEVAAALQVEVLDVRPQRIARAGIDGIGALARVLDDLIETVVDDVGVVAGSAVHVVGPGPAVDVVVAAVADDRIDEVVTDALEVAGAL